MPEYEGKPLELTETEREAIFGESKMKEVLDWVKRIRGKPEGRWLSDTNISTLGENLDFLVRRIESVERSNKYFRSDWLEAKVKTMRYREQLTDLRERFNVKETKYQREALKKIDRKTINQLEKHAEYLETKISKKENKMGGDSGTEN